jgi:hypothetical protein
MTQRLSIRRIACNTATLLRQADIVVLMQAEQKSNGEDSHY